MSGRKGFTMLEIVISLVLFTAGALGYAAVTTRLARSFYLNAQRSRSGDVISSRRETLVRQGCRAAASGSDNRFNLALRWNVEHSATIHTAVITATRPADAGAPRDSLASLIPCI